MKQNNHTHLQAPKKNQIGSRMRFWQKKKVRKVNKQIKKVDTALKKAQTELAGKFIFFFLNFSQK